MQKKQTAAAKKRAGATPKTDGTEIIMVEISSLVPSLKNPRVIRDDRYRKLVKSLKDFPGMLLKRPFVVFTNKAKKLEVLGGNQRLKACKDLKYTKVPVSMADDWTEKQRDEFLLKDNLNYGEWDWEQLAGGAWDIAELKDWGVEGLKFTRPIMDPGPGAADTKGRTKTTVQDMVCPNCDHHFKAETNKINVSNG
jgi:hypothetical protein